jgi:hypothetical protein
MKAPRRARRYLVMGALFYLRGLAKLAAVLVVGVALGAGLGFGMSIMTGGGAASDPVATQVKPIAADPAAKVLSAELERARSADGIARKRARLSVRVQLENPTGESLTVSRPQLVLPLGRTKADPNADSFAGELLRPIAPQSSATGVLRFETAGAVTQRLVDDQRGTIEIAGQTVAVAFRA